MPDNDFMTAEFNMAIGFLNRVNLEFYICNAASTASPIDTSAWYLHLLALHRELFAYMKPEQKERALTLKRILFERISWQNSMNKYSKGVLRVEVYEALDNFHLFLKEVMKSTGLEMKFQDDPANALGN